MNNYNKLISKNLNQKGYFVIKNFLNKSDIDQSMISYLKKKEKFVDGVIHGIDREFYLKIDKKIKKISKRLRHRNLNISDNKFCYASIKIKKRRTTEEQKT